MELDSIDHSEASLGIDFDEEGEKKRIELETKMIERRDQDLESFMDLSERTSHEGRGSWMIRAEK